MRVITHGTLTAIMVSSTLRPTIGVTGAMRSRRQMTRGKAEQRAGERPARWPAVAGVVLVVAMPVASWLLVGDLSTETADPDYFLRPVDLGDTRHNTWSASAPSCWWRASSSARSSARLQRPSGTPRVRGSSQATALA
jgi:hypothetical protein